MEKGKRNYLSNERHRAARFSNTRSTNRRSRRFFSLAQTADFSYSPTSILDLPDDAIFVIFRYLSPIQLGRVAMVCRRFQVLSSEDFVWAHHEREHTVPRMNNSRPALGMKERYRVSLNWENGIFHDTTLFQYNCRLMPWLQKEDNTLWLSSGTFVCNFTIQDNGHLLENKKKHLYSESLCTDLTRFVLKNGLLVSGCRDGSIIAWESSSSVRLHHFKKIHSSDVHCVDIIDDIIISGSRDKCVKIVSFLHDNETPVMKSFDVGDRVWSLSAAPNNSTVAVGTACYNSPPLLLWDFNCGQLLGHLSDGQKRGAGILDMTFESPNTLLTCGYDTYLRLWDLRTQSCVGLWEDTFDSALYCLQTDGNYTMLTGTARHGLVRLWDKRQQEHIQAYYTGCHGSSSSPVYSMIIDTCYVYTGLDMGLKMMDFLGH